MSICIDIKQLSAKQKKDIDKDLTVVITPVSKYNHVEKTLYMPVIEGTKAYLPFAYTIKTLKVHRPTRTQFTPSAITCNHIPREEQLKLIEEALPILNKTGSIMISAYPGFGKSFCAVKIASVIKLKTLIIVHKVNLMTQWTNDAINKFCDNVRIQIVKPKSVLDPDANIFIINAQNTIKMGKAFFKDIGLVICDEAHLIMATTLSKSLQQVNPRYLIGLTATPYRFDGLDILLEYYFGIHKLIREQHREHTIYKIQTSYKPVVEYTENGMLNWGVVIDSQSNNKERNDMIVDIIGRFPDRTFLILVKRISQGEYLTNSLLEHGETVTTMFGDVQEYDVNARILVGMIAKTGTGFDHPKLDALLLAVDVERYFVQYLGRVFRTQEVEPIIIDIVDDFSVLHKHYNTRKAVYTQLGGKFKKL